MPAEYRYDFGGVEVPDTIRFQFQRWADAALARDHAAQAYLQTAPS